MVYQYLFYTSISHSLDKYNTKVKVVWKFSQKRIYALDTANGGRLWFLLCSKPFLVEHTYRLKWPHFLAKTKKAECEHPALYINLT